MKGLLRSDLPFRHQQAKNYLTDDGILIVEIGNEAPYAEAAFAEYDLTWLSTSGGDDRVFLLTAEALKAVNP